MRNVFISTLVAAGVALSATPTFAQSGSASGGALGGAAAGAVGGAVIGGPVGAVIGGVAGAVGGAAVGSLTHEDQVYVSEYVTTHPAEPVVVQEKLVIGKPVPTAVKTYAIEGNPRLVGYRYARVDQQVVLIDRNGMVVGTVVH